MSSGPQVGDVIRSAEELDALQRESGAAVLDAYDVACQFDGRRWLRAGYLSVLLPFLPATLVYLPGRPPRPERVVKAEALREYADEWGRGHSYAAQAIRTTARSHADRIEAGGDLP